MTIQDVHWYHSIWLYAAVLSSVFTCFYFWCLYTYVSLPGAGKELTESVDTSVFTTVENFQIAREFRI